jgi:hypothetical protein
MRSIRWLALVALVVGLVPDTQAQADLSRLVVVGDSLSAGFQNTGYAILANEFIHTLNRRFDAQIDKVNVREVQRADPLVLADGHPQSAESQVPPTKAQELRRLFRR